MSLKRNNYSVEPIRRNVMPRYDTIHPEMVPATTELPRSYSSFWIVTFCYTENSQN